MTLYIFYKDTKVAQSLTDKEKLPELVLSEDDIKEGKMEKVGNAGHGCLKEDKEMSLV